MEAFSEQGCKFDAAIDISSSFSQGTFPKAIVPLPGTSGQTDFGVSARLFGHVAYLSQWPRHGRNGLRLVLRALF